MRINSISQTNNYNYKANKNQLQNFGMAVTKEGANFVYDIVRNDSIILARYWQLMERASANRDVHVDFSKLNGSNNVYMRLLDNEGGTFSGVLPVRNSTPVEIISMLKLGIDDAEIKSANLPTEIFTPEYRIKRLSIKRPE